MSPLCFLNHLNAVVVLDFTQQRTFPPHSTSSPANHSSPPHPTSTSVQLGGLPTSSSLERILPPFRKPDNLPLPTSASNAQPMKWSAKSLILGSQWTPARRPPHRAIRRLTGVDVSDSRLEFGQVCLQSIKATRLIDQHFPIKGLIPGPVSLSYKLEEVSYSHCNGRS